MHTSPRPLVGESEELRYYYSGYYRATGALRGEHGGSESTGACTDPKSEGGVTQVFLDEGTCALSCKG